MAPARSGMDAERVGSDKREVQSSGSEPLFSISSWMSKK